MNRREFFAASGVAALPHPSAPEPGPAQWLAEAERLTPTLHERVVTPVTLVRPVPDANAFFQWRLETVAPAGELRERTLRRGDAVVLDFGEHLTGYVTIELSGIGRSIDAPTRLKLIFGEVSPEIAEPFDPYHGTLSRAWLQDEIVTIDILPCRLRLPRRYAFRYLKLEVIDTSASYSLRIDNVSAADVNSANDEPSALAPWVPESLRRIDAVSIATLRNCMQTVFEDGPKRDRRLWIGDLRLQALTNYVTFRNFDLVKRCLLLFAALDPQTGLMPACIFEHPKPHASADCIVDYAALYAAAVLEYARASNDWATARALWPVVRRQMRLLSQWVRADGILAPPPGLWVFIDWSEPLDKAAAIQGVYVYSLRRALELARRADDRAEAAEYERRLQQLTAAAHEKFYDPQRRVFTSGPRRQVSYASQAWMILSGIASPTEGADALRAVAKVPDAVRPGGPYLYHFVVEAMLECGLKTEARQLLESYWGGMVKAGADTFWEVYDPAQPRLSPYGSALVNSYCHAWSCTHAYLLRRGGLL